MNKWAIWCKTLGSKIHECDKALDYACLLRTIYAIIMFGTCFLL